MKQLIRQLAQPILRPLEKAQGEFRYRPSHRTMLWVMGGLFLFLAAVTAYFSVLIQQWAGLLPVVLFAGIGKLCVVVAWVGSDTAVANLWKNRGAK